MVVFGGETFGCVTAGLEMRLRKEGKLISPSESSELSSPSELGITRGFAGSGAEDGGWLRLEVDASRLSWEAELSGCLNVLSSAATGDEDGEMVMELVLGASSFEGAGCIILGFGVGFRLKKLVILALLGGFGIVDVGSLCSYVVAGLPGLSGTR